MRFIKKHLNSFLSAPEKIFLAIALTTGILSSVLVPQLSVSDERMHFLRAYSLSQLSLSTDRCTFPPEIIQTAKDSDKKQYHSLYDARPTEKPNDMADGKSSSCGTAATYNPLLHTPQAIGIALANLFNAPIGVMILLGRIMNVVAYSFLIYFAIRAARVGRWPLVVIALFPTMIHTAGSLSADAINNAVVISFLAYTLSLFFQRTPASGQQLAFIMTLSLLIACTKTSNLPLLGFLLFLPSYLFVHKSSRNYKWPLILSLFTAVGLLIVGWSVASSHIPATSTATENPLATNPLFFLKVIYNTYLSPFIGYSDVVLEGITDYFSAFQYSLPNSMVVIGWIVLAIALLNKDKLYEELNQTQIKVLSILSLVCFAAIIAGITYVMYTAWAILPLRLGSSAIYADGVQGRYFTALLPLLIPPFIWAQRHVSIYVRKPYTIGCLIFLTSGGILSFYLYQSYSFAVMSGAI